MPYLSSSLTPLAATLLHILATLTFLPSTPLHTSLPSTPASAPRLTTTLTSRCLWHNILGVLIRLLSSSQASHSSQGPIIKLSPSSARLEVGDRWRARKVRKWQRMGAMNRLASLFSASSDSCIFFSVSFLFTISVFPRLYLSPPCTNLKPP